MPSFNAAANKNLDDFIYAKALHPVHLKNGMTIGGGTLYPEINFTLPAMTIDESTMGEVINNYKEILTGICERARDLSVPGFVAEVETLPPMTFNPRWGTDVCSTVVETIKEYAEKYGIKGAVRITPNDIREGEDLEHMWRGRHWDSIMETFESCARAGADLLSIESVGGKEAHDEAIMYCDIAKSLFALSVLGCTDMAKLWKAVTDIADKTGTISAGDTACGFANTAMVLADRNYIPKVFAAVVRVMSAVRSLVAIEYGAKGPHKDCGYEGVYLKAIAGIPIAMEGRTSACAHLSPVGNVAACLADLWSNESVQNIKLLGGMAPVVSFEQLAYDCRLMNTASQRGASLLMRDILADSDSSLDPQAYVLRPDVVLEISKEIVKESGYYERTRKAAELALEKIKQANKDGELNLDGKEILWLERLTEDMAALPGDAETLAEVMIPQCEKLDPAKYDLK
jgi:methanol--5-hydroxybenzimidazolylcobamide Co-methyltransferase